MVLQIPRRSSHQIRWLVFPSPRRGSRISKRGGLCHLQSAGVVGIQGQPVVVAGAVVVNVGFPVYRARAIGCLELGVVQSRISEAPLSSKPPREGTVQRPFATP